LDSRYANTSLR